MNATELRAAQEALGASTADLARIMDCSRRMVQLYLAGRPVPRLRADAVKRLVARRAKRAKPGTPLAEI